jgi:hypothetical protein
MQEQKILRNRGPIVVTIITSSPGFSSRFFICALLATCSVSCIPRTSHTLLHPCVLLDGLTHEPCSSRVRPSLVEIVHYWSNPPLLLREFFEFRQALASYIQLSFFCINSVKIALFLSTQRSQGPILTLEAAAFSIFSSQILIIPLIDGSEICHWGIHSFPRAGGLSTPLQSCQVFRSQFVTYMCVYFRRYRSDGVHIPGICEFVFSSNPSAENCIFYSIGTEIPQANSMNP